MDSPSWKDAVTAAIGSCLPCFISPNDTDPLQNSSRSRPPQHLEALLADPQDTDTEAETVSLHSNPSSRTRKKNKNKNKNKRNGGAGVTLFGLNLFGRRTGAIHLPEDEDELDRMLNRNQGSSSRIRRTSSASTGASGGTTTRSSSPTFDPDASPLDPASIDQLTPAQLEERARQAMLQAEEERRAREERKRIRREKKELKKLAARLAVSGPGDDGEFEGFQGSGALGVAAGVSPNNINAGYPYVPAPLLSPDTTITQSMDDEADGSADLDGTLYTGRIRTGGAASGGGSDSAASYQEYQYQYQYQHPNAVNLTPSTTPAVKKKQKSSSSKSKSSRSHSSAASSAQSPSLASPVGSEFTGLPSLVPPFAESRFPKKPTMVMPDSYSVEERGFPSPGLGGPTRVGRNGAFLASKGDDA